MKILIENYMAIQKCKLDLPEGTINVVTGANNNGKSCIIRAIEACIKNEAGNFFIRYGAKKAKVGLKFSDNIYVWEKSNKSIQYMVNGKVYRSVRRVALPELVENSGFQLEKELGNPPTIPNIVHEKTRMFPFDLTPSFIFRIFSRFLGNTRLEEIYKSQKEALKESRSALSKITILIEEYQKEVNTLQSKINAYPVDDVKLIELRRGIVEKNAVYRKLNLSLVFINDKVLRYDTLKSDVVNYTRTLKEYPDMIRGKELLSRYKELQDILRVIDTMQKRLHRLYENERILSRKAAFDFEALGSEISEYRKLKAILLKIDRYNHLVSKHKQYLKAYASVSVELKQYDFCPLCKSDLRGKKWKTF